MTDSGACLAARTDLTAVPLGWNNFVTAMIIAIRSFGSESFVIAICYLWHLLSLLGIRLDGMLLRRRRFAFHQAGQQVGELERLTSPLYGSDVCWIRLSCQAHIDRAQLIATLRQITAGYRLAVFRLETGDPLPAHWTELRAQGLLAGFAIYTLRSSGKHPHNAREALEARASNAKGEVSADFFLVIRNAKTIGLTGSYSVDFWPGIVWGGWGALIRSAGFRDAGIETVRLTECLAQRRKADLFCIETSNGPKYRAARKIYEIYGLSVLLEIPDFYHDGEAFLVFGKNLVNSGDLVDA